MKMVIGHVELGREMTTGTNRITGPANLETVGVMAVTAGDTCREHLALEERAIDIHLV
jgi:hypothetical protein